MSSIVESRILISYFWTLICPLKLSYNSPSTSSLFFLLSLTFNILKENLVTMKSLFDVTTITMLLWKKLHAEGDVHSIWLYPHKMHIISDNRKDTFLLKQPIVANIVIIYTKYHIIAKTHVIVKKEIFKKT